MIIRAKMILVYEFNVGDDWPTCSFKIVALQEKYNFWWKLILHDQISFVWIDANEDQLMRLF